MGDVANLPLVLGAGTLLSCLSMMTCDKRGKQKDRVRACEEDRNAYKNPFPSPTLLLSSAVIVDLGQSGVAGTLLPPTKYDGYEG